MSTTDEIRYAAPGPNGWEQKALHVAAHQGVLAACREAYADGMNWEQNQGGRAVSAFVECPLHGTIRADHRCDDSPGDHQCAYSAQPDAELDQCTPHREWDGIQSAKLHRIATAHRKYVDEHGGTDGCCAECERGWPCPTYRMATGWIDPFSGEWQGADEYAEGPAEFDGQGKDRGEWSALDECLTYKRTLEALRKVNPTVAGAFDAARASIEQEDAARLEASHA